MTIGKKDAADLRSAIRKLRAETAAPEIREALQSDRVKLYVETWIVPKIQRLVDKHDRAQERKANPSHDR